MPTVNLHKSYKEPLAKAFEYSSNLGGKTSSEYSWKGVNEIFITSIITDPLTDYNRAASSGRYGTPSEVNDWMQSMILDKDRSFTKTVDKGNYQEANYLKTGAAVTKAYMDEQVSPELERYFYKRMALCAGKTLTISAAPTDSTIIGMLTDIETYFEDHRVPKTDRFVAVPYKYIAALRQALKNCDTITDRLLLKGIVGDFGTLHIIGVAEADIPANCYAVAWQKNSAVYPKTIDDCKVSQDVPGISGLLIEGRFRFGAFVVGKKADGVVTVVKTSNKCTTSVSAAKAITAGNASHVLYTTDGSDPRYSTTATKVATSGAITASSGAVLKYCGIKEDLTYFPSDVGTVTIS